MAKYLAELPDPPASLSRTPVVTDWGMYSNDTVGDCTMAALAHMVMLITAFTGTPVVPDPADILKIYYSLTGGADTGLDLPTVLNYWRDTGIAGHKIVQWGDIDPADMQRQRQAMNIFGAVDQAAMMPPSALPQFESGQDWTIVTGEQGQDGHSFPSFDYRENGNVGSITWAKEQWANPGWLIENLMESCAAISPEWVSQNPASVPGTVMDTLIADLKAMGSWTNV